MGRHGRDALTFGCALALANVQSMSVRAEFPPEGAISDPNNPSIATGDYPDQAHNGVTRHYIFYFDCGKRDWIGVSVADTKGDRSAPPQAVGNGREFPSGPPPGSKYEAGSSNRATRIASGQTFSLRQGIWFDAKTAKPVTSPNLCPRSPFGQKAMKHSKGPDHGPPSADQSAPASDQKPDQLPPPPQYIPKHSND